MNAFAIQSEALLSTTPSTNNLNKTHQNQGLLSHSTLNLEETLITLQRLFFCVAPVMEMDFESLS